MRGVSPGAGERFEYFKLRIDRAADSNLLSLLGSRFRLYWECVFKAAIITELTGRAGLLEGKGVIRRFSAVLLTTTTKRQLLIDCRSSAMSFSILLTRRLWC
jgi:hypothetical protein